MESNRNQRRIATMFVCLLIILLECFFFRELLASPYAMIGDRGDARLNNLIMEHWYKVFQGLEPVRNMCIFYPVENTISYTDMLLGTSILYSILRFFGVNMFLANKITLIGVHCMGSFSLFYLVEKQFKLDGIYALIGVISFSFANGYAMRIGHTQMIALSYVPALILLFMLFYNHIQEEKKRRLYLFLVATGLALLAYTGWYITFFLAIFTSILLINVAVFLWMYKKSVLASILDIIKKFWWETVLAAVYLCGLMVPFLKMYLPTSRLFGKRSWNEITLMLPDAVDLINVSTSNYAFGKVIERFNFTNNRTRYEHEVCQGFSVISLLVIIILGIFLCKRIVRNVMANKVSTKDILVFSLLNSVTISIFLIMQSCGVSAWYFIYKIVPGASSLRAVSRYYFFLLLPMGILTALLVSDFASAIKVKKLRNVFLFILAIAVWVTNISGNRISAWSYDTDIDLLESIPSPPQEATIIALKDSRDQPDLSYIIQLDAFLLADYYGLKTVNGYSGQFPPEWQACFRDVQKADVARWANLQEIDEPIYAYDKGTCKWSLIENVNSSARSKF